MSSTGRSDNFSVSAGCTLIFLIPASKTMAHILKWRKHLAMMGLSGSGDYIDRQQPDGSLWYVTIVCQKFD